MRWNAIVSLSAAASGTGTALATTVRVPIPSSAVAIPSSSSPGLDVDELTPEGTLLRLLGQFEPPGIAEIEVQTDAGEIIVGTESDPLGRFRLDLTPGVSAIAGSSASGPTAACGVSTPIRITMSAIESVVVRQATFEQAGAGRIRTDS